MQDHVWVLSRIEYCGTQCTGFSSETTIRGIFIDKPNLRNLAPFLKGDLSADMATAIGQVEALIEDGQVSTQDIIDYSLEQVELNTLLNV